MPEPDDKTAAATAEPEATPGAGAPVSEELQPGPAAEQEPSEEEPSEEGAARGPEDEGEEPKEAEPLDAKAALRERLSGLDDAERALLRETLLSSQEQERLRGEPGPEADERLQELSARETRLDRREKEGQKLATFKARWDAVSEQPWVWPVQRGIRTAGQAGRRRPS